MSPVARGQVASTFLTPKNMAYERKKQLYTSTEVSNAIIPYSLPKQEAYQRKAAENLGPFQSPTPKIAKAFAVQPVAKLIDGTHVKLSTSNKNFKSFKSTYKNASSISFEHATAGGDKDKNTLNRVSRNW